MLIEQTRIPGLFLLSPTVHRDERGFFLETFRADFFADLGFLPFVQDNHARSEAAGVVRGLHFQSPPMAQGKLVWVLRGSIFDVAVDIRKNSPTYGQWFGATLSADNFKRLLVPRGFAHGYMTLEPGTEVAYKVDAYYAPSLDGGIPWNDPDIGITWPQIPPILSDKDKRFKPFAQFCSPFSYQQEERT